MKEVLLIRHAKSSWEYPHLPDLERPLNQRGLRDAPFMASFLRSQAIIPSNIISQKIEFGKKQNSTSDLKRIGWIAFII
ncbi:MAG: SixA phosphatase family protein [Saprospiraceae bacterium]